MGLICNFCLEGGLYREGRIRERGLIERGLICNFCLERGLYREGLNREGHYLQFLLGKGAL